jgi:hypothetical protein
MKSFFTRLRERQERRAKDRVHRETFAHAVTRARLLSHSQRASATFLAAERVGAPADVLRKLADEAIAANAEMDALRAREKSDIAESFDLYDPEKKFREEK